MLKRIFLAIYLCVAPVLAVSQEVTAIVGGTVVDLNGGDPIEDAVIVVREGRIQALGQASEVEVPAGASRIDATGTWLIPGLMNLHVHLGLTLPGRQGAELATESDIDLAYRVADNARKALLSGVTTLRLPGDKRGTGLALRRAIERGYVDGPRIFSASDMVGITAGHGTRHLKEGQTADGPYELIKEVRTRVNEGAEWIKIAISGGIADQRGAIAEALMTPEEIRAVIDAAHRFGRKVTAHSGSPQATAVAVDAGIDCIEHGYFLDRATLRQMKEAGTWLVPTIVVSQPTIMPFFERIGSPPWYLERVRSVGESHWQALQMAIEEDVRIALGTDQFPHEPNDGTTATIREAQYYVEAGMTPLQALRSATIAPAELLDADKDLGSLEVGKYADILALAEDPVADIMALRNILLIMKDGFVYHNTLQ